MALISFIEIVNIIIATLVVGYIFTGLFNIRKRDVLDAYIKRFDWRDFWFSCMVAAPGIILHEMAHKFVALGFGLGAVFHISSFGLVLGVLLKLFGSGFIILAPGYVEIFGANSSQMIITAFAGPFMNLLMWGLAFFVLKYKKNITRKEAILWSLGSHINKWLFIFNILPIPPLDGYKFWFTLFQMIF